MNLNERGNARDGIHAGLAFNLSMIEAMEARGRYDVLCRGAKYQADVPRLSQLQVEYQACRDYARIDRLEQELAEIPLVEKWHENFPNVVCTEGKNVALDAMYSASYTVVGPYIGLISSVSWTAVAAGDTMAQIEGTNGWREAGSTHAPTFSARIVAAFSSASANLKSLSSALAFTMTGAGTVKGCFMVYGTSAVTTLLSTAGKLLSAGTFSADKVVVNTDVINVSYSMAL